MVGGVGGGGGVRHTVVVVSVVPGCGEPGSLTGSCLDHTEAGAQLHQPATSINTHTHHAHTPTPRTPRGITPLITHHIHQTH